MAPTPPDGDDWTVPDDGAVWAHDTATVDGVTLHTVTAGPADGDLVVLLHGFPEFWYSWRHQIDPLVDAGYRLLIPDLRGYNCSEKPAGVGAYHIDELVADVAGLVDHAGREAAHVVGHDWGGTIAWQVGADRPDVVDRLTILNSPHPSAYERELRSVAQFRRSWYVFAAQFPRLPEYSIRRNDYAELEEIFRGEAVSDDAFTDEDLRRYRTAIAREGALTAAFNYYRAAFRRSATLGLTQGGVGDVDVGVPTLLLWGERDGALTTGNLDGLERWVSDLHIERFPDASHWVHHERPAGVTEHLLDHLDAGSDPVTR